MGNRGFFEEHDVLFKVRGVSDKKIVEVFNLSVWLTDRYYICYSINK